MTLPPARVASAPVLGTRRAAGLRAAAEAAGVLWRFGRPHTLVGTTFSVFGLGALVLLAPGGLAAARAAAPAAAGALLLTWLAALAANLFIVGLNELVDVPIDAVNKPELPLPAGDLTPRAGRRIVAAAGTVALGLGVLGGPWLAGTLAAAMVVGAAYSLPPARLKRSALGAPAAIALVRGPLVNLGLYAHLAATLGRGPAPTAWVGLLAGFMTLFALAVGVAKDLPDVVGDRAHGVGNLAVRRGAPAARRTAVGLLAAAYLITAAAGAFVLPGAGAATLATLHAALLAALWRLARAAGRRLPADPPGDPRAVDRAFYRGVWRLFHLEYVALPLAAQAAAWLG